MAFGGFFEPQNEPFEIREVAIVSAQEFDALFAPEIAPERAEDIVELPSIEPEEQAPAFPSVAEASAPTPEVPAVVQSAAPDSVPDNDNLYVAPEPKPLDMPPEIQPEIQPPMEQVAILAPQTQQPPQPKSVAKIAPEPVQAPEPEIPIAEETPPVAQVEPAPEVPETPDKPREEKVEEEAVAEITPETMEPPSGAPERSLRPMLRPTKNTALTQSDSVVLALQEALSAPGPETATPSSPSGFQMTSSEKNAIKRHLKPCWTVDVGSLSADIVVTLRWKMSPDGKLVAGSLRMIDSEGGDGSALRSAVQIAKSTVFRCGNKMGANLPPEKYDEWQEIEVRFDPSEMRTQ